MAFTLNKIMLIGKLGKDAETRMTSGNAEVISFSLATDNSFKNKEGGYTNETTWHNIVAFNLSDYFKSRLKKGAKVYVEGRLSKREYEKDGVKQYFTEVIADAYSLIILDGQDQKGSQTGSTEYSTPVQVENYVAEEGEKDDSLPF